MRAPTRTVDLARRLRRQLTPPEVRLWVRLRPRELGAPVFRRQHPIGPYVLDFYCVPARLAVEVDGLAHDGAGAAERDARRDAWLRAQGLTIVRMPASDVMRDPDAAADGVRRMAAALMRAD